MAEEKYEMQTDVQEEYQFNEPNEGATLQDADLFDSESTKPAWQERLKDPKVFIPAGFILGVLLLYLITKALFGGSANEEVLPEALTPAPVVERDHMSQIEEELAALEMGYREQRNLNTRLERRANELATQIANLQQSNQQLMSVVEAMTMQLIHQGELLEGLIKKTDKEETKADDVVMEPELPEYYIQAMIPGRAWLFQKSGGASNTVTVTRGDNLPGYGKVIGIDPGRGVVILDSGDLIGYRD